MGDVISGITGAIFGEAPKTETQQVGKLTPDQSNLLSALIKQITGQIGKGVTPYPQSESPLQSSTFDLVNQIISGTGEFGGSFKEGRTAISSFLEPYSDEEATNYWETAVYKPALQDFEGTIGSIIEPYIASGAGNSSASKRAVAEAGRKLITDLAASKASTLLNEKNKYESNKLNAIGDIINYTMLPYNMAKESGQTQYAQDINRWLSSQPYNNPWLQYIGPALGTSSYDTVVNQQGPTEGIFGQLMPVLGSFVGSEAGSALLASLL